MTAPAVSVIMATYNGASLVGETIRSVLAQSFADFELIAVDDCSSDETCDVVRSFADPRVKLLRTPFNSGPVRARNQAVAAARGRYIAAMDQDDLCLPERFAKQVAFLDANPRVVVLGTAVQRLTDGRLVNDRFGGHTTPALLHWMLHILNPLVWSTVMLRAEAVRGFAEFSRVERQFAEDYDLYHRLAPFGQIARLDEVLLHYRWHAAGASSTKEAAMMQSAAAVLAEAYAPWFGENARAAAMLMTRHVSARKPVPDLATYLKLRSIFAKVTQWFDKAYPMDEATRTMVAAESGQLLRGLAGDAVKAKVRWIPQPARKGQEARSF